MAKTTPYLEFLLEQFEPLGQITARAMFSGYGLYCNGVFFAIVAKHSLYLKTDDENRAEFEARGLRRFRPFENGKSVMPYYEAPAEMFEDPDMLKHWAGGSVQAGIRAQAKKQPKKRM